MRKSVPRITHFDRDKLKKLNELIKAAIVEVCTPFGLNVSSKGGSYTPNNYTIKYEIQTKGENGEVHTKEAQAFKRYATEYGFKPEDLGKRFMRNGEEFKLIGIATRRPKFPIQAVRIRDNQTFKFGVHTVAIMKLY